MKKPIILLDKAWTPARQPNLRHCLTNDLGANHAETSESVALMRDFAEDLQSLLASIASMFEALHTPELDHWTRSQRQVIDKLHKAIREAATVVDQVRVEFAVPNHGLSEHRISADKLTH